MNNVIEMFLEGQGLNWDVQKQNLSLPNGDSTDYFANVRSDINVPLGISKEGYEVFQNSELAEIAYKIADKTGYKVDSGNLYDDGKKVSIFLKGKSKTLEYAKVGDVIERGTLLTNTFDSTEGLRVKDFTKTLSCSNGMTRTKTNKLASIRHTTNMRSIIDQALVEVELINNQQESMFDEIKRMIEVKMNPTDQLVKSAVERMTKIATGIDVNEIPEGGFSTRANNLVQSFLSSVKEETDYKGFNVWGLLSGVTHFTTHKRGGDKNRDRNKVFGQSASIDNAAFNYANELVEILN